MRTTLLQVICGLLAFLMLGYAGEWDYQDAVAERAVFAAIEVAER